MALCRTTGDTMHRIMITASLLLSLTTLPALAEKAPTLKILTTHGFDCTQVDNGILHCSNQGSNDEYDCIPKPDAPCKAAPPAPQQSTGAGGRFPTAANINGGLTIKAH
jgi:hypothetical protein